jgi:hypothetical protein
MDPELPGAACSAPEVGPVGIVKLNLEDTLRRGQLLVRVFVQLRLGAGQGIFKRFFGIPAASREGIENFFVNFNLWHDSIIGQKDDILQEDAVGSIPTVLCILYETIEIFI